MKRLIAFLALLGCTAAQAAPETYIIDGSQTTSLFTYRYLGISSQTHRFERISGKVVLDAVTGAGSADVTIDATSVNTGHPLLNGKIQDADFFDTARYPSITFKSTRMTLDGDDSVMTGELTIKDVTRPVTLAVTQFKCMPHVALKEEACGALASVTIRRSDFNMGKLALLVSDEITLNLAIRAVRQVPVLQLASRDPIP